MRLQETIHLVAGFEAKQSPALASGRVHAGFDAYRALAWRLPLGWPLLPTLYLPPVPWVGRRLYGRIAATRHRATCARPGGAATLPAGGML